MAVANIIVTGGAGYIGSHACKCLKQAGFVPVTVDNLSRGVADAVRYGPLEVGDVRDGAFLETVFAKYRPDAVIHFAALAYVGESVQRPYLYYDNNVGGTVSLLEAMRAADIGRIVFSSTCAVYGAAQTVPITESHPLAPINPYGASKRMVEQVLADGATAHGLRFVALRYFNASGADPDGELAENHDPETHLIPLALQAAFGRRPALQVFGTDYDTPDGTCIRDYIHVADLAEAHVLALKYLLDGGAPLFANLGTGSGASVREVIRTVEAVTGRLVPAEDSPRRPGDPAALVADPGMANTVLGWRPRFMDLTDHVRHAAVVAEHGPRPRLAVS